MPNVLKLAEYKLNTETFYFDLEEILQSSLSLPINVIKIVLNYLSPFLNSALTNSAALSQIGAFLDKTELISFFFINHFMSSIAGQFIYSHFLPIPSSNQQIILPKKTRVKQLINDLEFTILHDINSGHMLVAGLLIISKILSVNAQFLDGALILHTVKSHNSKALNFLLQQKAEIKEVKGLKDQENLLTLAFKNDYLEIYKILLPFFSPVPIGLQSNSGTTLFMQAVEHEDIAFMTELLTSRGAEINPPDQRPLKQTIHQKNLKTTQFLLENGVKIKSATTESKAEDFSPLYYFVQRCQTTIFESNTAISLFHEFTKMFDLLLHHGDKIDGIKPSYIRTLFLNQDHILARIIISHGGSADEINIFDIYLRLNYIVSFSAEGNDSDSLLFWLNILMTKLTDFDTRYESLLEEAAMLFEGSLYPELPIIELPPQVYTEKIFHITKATLILTKDQAQNTKNWSTIKYFTNELTSAAKQFLYIKIKESNKLNGNTDNFSDSDSEPTETEAKGSALPPAPNVLTTPTTNFRLFDLNPVESKRINSEAKFEVSTQSESYIEAKLSVNQAEAEYKSAQQEVEKAKNEHRNKGRAGSLAKLETKAILSRGLKNQDPEKLSQAQAREIKAVKEYQLTIANLDQAKKELLNAKTNLVLANAKFAEVNHFINESIHVHQRRSSGFGFPLLQPATIEGESKNSFAVEPSKSNSSSQSTSSSSFAT